jgi:pheromone a factor receptor
VLLSYRLYRYRREFVRLVAARNTTKSRFIRLFIICIVIIAAYVPYTIWLLVVICRTLTDTYSWHRVHNPASFHSIIKQPVHGVVSVDKWGQVASGYVLFFVLGTGADAYNTYKKMLTAMGLGRIFPSLYILRESGASTPNSFLNARSWTESLSSKAKGMFWSRSSSVAESTLISSRNNSLAVVDTGARCEQQSNRESAWLGRLWGRRAQQQQTMLPVFVDQRIRSMAEMTVDDDAHKEKVSPRAETSSDAEHAGMSVLHGVRLEMDEKVTENKAHDAWVASVKGGPDAV